MEKMDFPKGTKPREIFVYTCERIAEPLIPLGYKYRKSKNDIYKKDGIFVFSFYFSPSIRFGSTTFTAFFDVSSPVIAQWRSEQEGTEDTYDGIVGTSIARLTRRYDDFPRYEVSTLLERERRWHHPDHDRSPQQRQRLHQDGYGRRRQSGLYPERRSGLSGGRCIQDGRQGRSSPL